MVFKVAVFLLLATALLAKGKASNPLDTDQCHVGTLYKAALPSGGSGVSHLKVLGVGVTADKCLSECCALGPTGCQYLWVLDDTCIAVACENVQLSSCEPKAVATTKISSVYVNIVHPEPLPGNLDNALDWVNQVMHGNKDGGDDKGDSPPIAATPTDEIVVTLPTKDVYIYGNSSKDDKGIASYSWKLLSEHFVQPILENTDKAILHVKNLIPGIYTFSLTVTDTSGQSGRTTVLVRVEKGSTSSIVVTTTLSTKAAERTTTTQAPTTHLTTTLNAEAENSNSTEIAEEESFYTKRRNVLKIVIPVLLSVAVLLVLTAAITTACACCCQRNKHRMKRYYKYKKLPETIEKT